jgi:hypothetical protein
MDKTTKNTELDFISQYPIHIDDKPIDTNYSENNHDAKRASISTSINKLQNEIKTLSKQKDSELYRGFWELFQKSAQNFFSLIWGFLKYLPVKLTANTEDFIKKITAISQLNNQYKKDINAKNEQLKYLNMLKNNDSIEKIRANRAKCETSLITSCNKATSTLEATKHNFIQTKQNSVKTIENKEKLKYLNLLETTLDDINNEIDGLYYQKESTEKNINKNSQGIFGFLQNIKHKRKLSEITNEIEFLNFVKTTKQIHKEEKLNKASCKDIIPTAPEQETDFTDNTVNQNLEAEQAIEFDLRYVFF